MKRERKITLEEERQALAMGASRAAVFKWRIRGMPWQWRFKMREVQQNNQSGAAGEAA